MNFENLVFFGVFVFVVKMCVCVVQFFGVIFFGYGYFVSFVWCVDLVGGCLEYCCLEMQVEENFESGCCLMCG